VTLDFDAFRKAVAEAGEVPLRSVTPEARLIEDLGFDSLRLLMLLAALVDLGVEEPEGVTLAASTVADAYNVASAGAGPELLAK
jgi:acyl carrier protein